MKLLIITQKIDVNDDILGFFHRWVEEFAKRAEKIVVIAQYVGTYNLSQNVEVFSLGKEKGYSKIRQFFNFKILLLKNLKKVDAVFVHMIPMWIVLGAPFFKIFRKKVYLWYVHKSVNFWLKIAEKFVAKIFTASPESCRLKSNKIAIMGHGIDVDKFQIPNKFKIQNSKFRIITAGRIAAVKNLDLLIEAAEILKNKGFDFEIKIAGSPILEKDRNYLEKLENLIKEKKIGDRIKFVGPVPYRDISEFYQAGDLFFNFSDTGSMDKAVLEAMASGCLILTSNEAFKNILPPKYFTTKNPQEIAEKIIMLSKASPEPGLKDCVIKNHSLDKLINKIIVLMK
jgi:glycosyltransferase involved in cell wall biosynthesis